MYTNTLIANPEIIKVKERKTFDGSVYFPDITECGLSEQPQIPLILWRWNGPPEGCPSQCLGL